MRYRVMSSLSRRGRLAARLVLIFVTGLSLSLTTACSSKSPAEPSSAGTSPSPNVSIVSMSVASETLVSGAHVYRVTVKLRESGGAAATIASIDLTFMSESTAVASLHVDQPMADAGNVLAANATIDSRELMTTDEDRSHPHATSVVAKVNYTYGAALTRSADGTAAVPLSVAPTFALAGVVTEENTGGRAVGGATVQVVDGANAGKSSSTDGNGNYTLADLTAGSFTVRASANGYDAAERNVTVAQDTRLDLGLRRTSSAPPPSGACAYTVAPSAVTTNFRGGSLSAAVSRTSGNCSWQASSDVSWITFPGGGSGNGNATLGYLVLVNGGVVTTNTRFATITISWTGGSAQLRVQQGGADPSLCLWSLAKGPQDFNNVPAAGGQLTATVTITDTGNPQCRVMVLDNTPWIKGIGMFGPTAGTFTFTMTVDPNPAPGTARNGSVTVGQSGGGQTASLPVTQR